MQENGEYMKNNKTAMICYGLATIGFLACSLINFSKGETTTGILYLALGVANMGLAASHSRKK